MKKRIIVFLTAIFSLYACSIPLDISNGRLLSSDSEGHLLEDVYYSNGSQNVSFLTDGSFLMATTDYELSNDLDNDGISNEGWVLTSGSRGTYVYDSSHFTFSLSFAQKYRSLGGANLWDPLTNDGDTILNQGNGIFTESMYYIQGNIFLKTDGIAWTNFYITKYYNGNRDVTRETYRIDTSAGSSSFLTTDLTYSNTGELISGSQDLNTETIVASYPLNTPWKTGNTLTFNVIRDFRYSGMTYSGGTWGSYTSTNSNPSPDVITLDNQGDFILAYPVVYSLR